MILLLAQSETGTLLEYIEWGGSIALLVIFLVGFRQEWWVTGVAHHRKIDELKEARKECNDIQTRYDEYRDKIEDDTLPVLIRLTDQLSRFVERRHNGADT